jgi:DNA-binding MarR family transcriptional regulator
MSDKISQDQIGLWRDFIFCHANLIGNLEHELKQQKVISPLWYDVLVTLWKQPEKRMLLSQLADAVILSRCTLSRVVDRLEKEQYLRRENCPDDGRCSYAVLTDAGIDAMRKAWRPYRRVLSEKFFSPLTDAEQRQLGTILGKLNSARGR